MAPFPQMMAPPQNAGRFKSEFLNLNLQELQKPFRFGMRRKYANFSISSIGELTGSFSYRYQSNDGSRCHSRQNRLLLRKTGALIEFAVQ